MLQKETDGFAKGGLDTHDRPPITFALSLVDIARTGAASALRAIRGAAWCVQQCALARLLDSIVKTEGRKLAKRVGRTVDHHRAYCCST